MLTTASARRRGSATLAALGLIAAGLVWQLSPSEPALEIHTVKTPPHGDTPAPRLSGTTPTTISHQSGGMVVPAVARLLEQGWDQGWLQARGIATHAVAAERLARLLDGREDAAGTPQLRLQFTPAPGALANPGEIEARLAPTQRYLYVELPHSQLPGVDEFIVRWRDLETGQLMEMSRQAVARDAGTSPVWRFRDDDWPPGRYRLELLSADASLRFLAVADLQIVSGAQTLSSYALPVPRP